jgi:serine/threonine-protein kinase RsbW
MAILPAESGIWREIVITGDSVQVGRLQDDVERELIFCQFAAKEVFSIKLAVQEAVVNAIKHGNRMDPEKKVFIRYRISSERFDIHVIDEGRGFNPDEVPNAVAEENLERPSGRGLLLMRHYMTAVVFHAPGNRLSMSMVRRPIDNVPPRRQRCPRDQSS